MAISENSDEMPLKAPFHQGLHCLLKQNQSSEKEIHFFFKLYLVTPQYTKWTILTQLYVALWKILLVLNLVVDRQFYKLAKYLKMNV